MKLLIPFLLCAAAWSQTITPTTITGPISTPFGVLFSGRLQVTAPDLICAGTRYTRWTQVYTVTAGAFAVSPSLYPTDACRPTAPGVQGVYMWTFIGADGSRYSQYFGVPTSATPVTFSTLSQLSATGLPWTGPVTSINGATGALLLPGMAHYETIVTGTSISIAATVHGCGIYPVMAVYSGNALVPVSYAVSAAGDITATSLKSGTYQVIVNSDAGVSTVGGSGGGMQADWVASVGPAAILNKPLLTPAGIGAEPVDPNIIRKDGSGNVTLPGTVAVGANVLDPVSGVWSPERDRYNRSTLRNWQSQWTKSTIGTGQAIVAYLGDSWTAGLSITDPLTTYLQARLGNAGVGYISLATVDIPSNSSRTITTTGTWTRKNGNTDITAEGIDGYSITSSDIATPATVYFTVFSPTSSMIIHWYGRTGGGSFNYSVDGGTPVVVNTSTVLGYQTTTISGLVLTQHKLVLTVTAAGTSGVTVMGVDCQSSLPGVRVHTVGHSGSGTASWLSWNAANWEAGILALNPSLVIIHHGVNDRNGSLPLATFTANLLAMAARVHEVLPLADIVLVSNPDNGNVASISWLAYHDAAMAAARTGRFGFVDYYANFGTYADSTTRGLFLGNNHPSATGGQYMSQLMGSYLSDGLDAPSVFSGSRLNLSGSSSPDGLFGFGKVENLHTYSTQYSNAIWIKQDNTITSNAALAPDGSMTATLMTEGTTSASHSVYEAAIVTAQPYTLSAYAKAGPGRSILWLHFDTGTGYGTYFDLAAGTIQVGTASYVNSMTALPNGWYRCAISTVATAATWYSSLSIRQSMSTANYVGDGVSGLYVWGAQLNTGYAALPLAITAATVVSRSAAFTAPNIVW